MCLQTCAILGTRRTIISTPGTKKAQGLCETPLTTTQKNKEAVHLAPSSLRKLCEPEVKGLFFYSQAAKPSSSPHSLPRVKLCKLTVNLGELRFCTEEFHIKDSFPPPPACSLESSNRTPDINLKS